MTEVAGTLTCDKCGVSLPAGTLNAPDFADCPSCSAPLLTVVFPALVRGPQKGRTAEMVMVDSEAGCFYHPAKRAANVCENCGRFLCALCEITIGERRLCPACVQSDSGNLAVANVKRSVVRYDNIALALALGPLIFWPTTVLTAPTTLFAVIYFWRRPLGIIPRSRMRLVLAFLIALLETGIWVAVFVSLAFD